MEQIPPDGLSQAAAHPGKHFHADQILADNHAVADAASLRHMGQWQVEAHDCYVVHGVRAEEVGSTDMVHSALGDDQVPYVQLIAECHAVAFHAGTSAPCGDTEKAAFAAAVVVVVAGTSMEGIVDVTADASSVADQMARRKNRDICDA